MEATITMLVDRFGLTARQLSTTLETEVRGLKSDLRVEIATLRRESVAAANAVLDDVKAQRRLLAPTCWHVWWPKSPVA